MLRKKLSDYSQNIYSQFGEDGIIQKIFSIVQPKSKICIEFGAWDGFYFSNTANLWTNNWQGILIESDKNKFRNLIERTRKYNCVCLNEFVQATGNNTLEQLLNRNKLPTAIDFLSIDVDGDDYYIFQSLQNLRPQLISCEYNPTIPIFLDLVPERRNNFGCSAYSIVKLAEQKGYKLIAMTDTNCFFITNENASKFNDYESNLISIAPNKHLTYLLTGYDGSYMLSQKPTYGLTHPTTTKFTGQYFQFPRNINFLSLSFKKILSLSWIRRKTP